MRSTIVAVVGLGLIAGPAVAPADAAAPGPGYTSITTVSGWGSFSSRQSQVPPGLSGRQVIAVTAGEEHSIVLTADGRLTGWGWNGHGQAVPPADLRSGATPVGSVDAGDHHGLAVLRDGRVRGWGAGGDSDAGQADVPADLAPVDQVAAGRYHSLARTVDRRVVAWGALDRHGDVDQGQARVPTSLRDGSHPVIDVAAGAAHSLAVDESGAIWAWGSNDQGQTDVPAAALPAVAVAAYGAVSMALTADGRVVAWGDSGTGTTAVPTALTSQRVVAIDLGAQVALALTSTGRVVVWGDSGTPLPAAIAAHPPYTGIAAGGRHALVLHRQPRTTTRLALGAPVRARAGRPVRVSLRLEGVASGRVVVRDGAKVVRTMTVTRAASFTLRLRKGRHRLSASYAGSALAGPATAPGRRVVVVRKPSRR